MTESSWAGYYRGFHVARAASGWEVRTGIARTIHPSDEFGALYSDREKRERVYRALLATKPTRKAARAFADRKIARERRAS